MTSISSIQSAQPTALTAFRQQMSGLIKTSTDAAAKALNMDSSDLQAQLKSGKSLKDIAAAQGVAFSTVQDAISSAVKPQIDQAVSAGQLSVTQGASVLSKLTSGEAPKAHHHHHGGGGGASEQKAIDAAAQALSMDPSQLLDQLKSGKSLQDLATAAGVDFSKVQTAMTSAVSGSAYSGSGGTTATASGTGGLVNAAA